MDNGGSEEVGRQAGRLETCTRPTALTCANPTAHRPTGLCGVGTEGYNRTGLEEGHNQ